MRGREAVGPALRAASRAARTGGRAYARVVVDGRWYVVAAWLVAAVAVLLLPPAPGTSGRLLGGLLPATSDALRVQERSLEAFDVPLLSGTAVVVHDPAGLDLLTRADVALWGLATSQAELEGRVPDGPGHLVGAVPLPTGSADTAVTYLYASPGTSLTRTTELARQYAAHFHDQASVRTYVTGVTPAQVAQGDHLESRLGAFEAASVVVIAGVVALAFRSWVAPVAVLAVAGVGFVVSARLLSALAQALGFSLPDQIEPLVVALFLGVVTDYCVLLFSTFHQELATAEDPREAARRAVARDAPVVAVAGLTVAGGTIALLAGDLGFFRSFGPALSLTVVVGLLLSLTLAPAVMTILGRRLFSLRRQQEALGTTSRAPDRPRSRVHLLTTRRGAAVATAAGVALLLLAALPVLHLRLDQSFTAGLPEDDGARRGAQVLQDSGVRGASAPTELLVEGQGVASERDALARFQELIGRQPEVVGVVGPADSPTAQEHGIVLSEGGDAARLLVVLGSDPLGAEAIADLRALQGRLDGLAREAGLAGASVAVTGQTAVASELTALTRADLERTLLVALGVELVLLALYLRALVAPLALLACSALSVVAALGLTTWVFQDLGGAEGLVFYAPFATAVLLVALGSDYNVFAVGAIWSEAARRPLGEAIAVAVPRSTRAITTAGVILAATFAMVAIIPLATFRQIAFTMTVGLVLDTFLVRPVLTPAVLTLLGRAAGWPGHRIRTAPGEPRPPSGEEAARG